MAVPKYIVKFEVVEEVRVICPKLESENIFSSVGVTNPCFVVRSVLKLTAGSPPNENGEKVKEF